MFHGSSKHDNARFAEPLVGSDLIGSVLTGLELIGLALIGILSFKHISIYRGRQNNTYAP